MDCSLEAFVVVEAMERRKDDSPTIVTCVMRVEESDGLEVASSEPRLHCPAVRLRVGHQVSVRIWAVLSSPSSCRR